MDETSLSLLERLRDQADEADWQRLTDLYRPWLMSWLQRRQGLSEADAEDLVQDILIVVHRELPYFQHNQRAGAFRSWLRTIAVHRLRDGLRARRYRPVAAGGGVLDALHELEDPTSAMSKEWELAHDRYVMSQLLALIEPDFQPTTWQAFRGVMLDGEKPAAVAQRLSISVNAVLLAKSRILARLRQEACGLVEGA